jgi:hypothetical protein
MAAARLAASMVLPAPPFCWATVMMKAMSPTPLHRGSIGSYRMKVFWFFF